MTSKGSFEVDLDKTVKDRANCSALFPFPGEYDEIIFGKNKYKKEEIKIFREELGDRIFVFKSQERWITLSADLYDSAQAMFEVWFGKTNQFMITEKKDTPLILINEDMGIILAPRIETEDQE